MQAVKTSGSTNLRILCLTTPMPQFSKQANLVQECDATVNDCTLKAYLCFYLDAEDSFEDELNYYVLVKLALLKSMQYAFRSPYRT